MKLTAHFIYGLIACVVLISAPHAEHLPLWVSLVSALFMLWRGYLVYSNKPLPQQGLLFILMAGSVGGIFITFHTLLGREAGVTLLILLAALKLLEVRSARDATIIIYLACFILIAEFFYSQSLFTALLMLATLLFILATWIHLHSGPLAFGPRIRIAGMILIQAIPLTLILFVLFPRVQGPLWGLPQDAYANTGLDDKMSPGSVGHLALSDEVAFRVTFNGTPPRRNQMYWRGPVLWNFDGQTWTPGKSNFGQIKPLRLDNLGLPLDYTVTLEPHNKIWLFALEMPTHISIPAGFTYDFQVWQKAPVTSRLRYTAHSQLSYRANDEEDKRQLQRALRIPINLNPRAQILAAQWRANSSSDEDITRKALTYFNQEGFQYTLSPPPLGVNEVDDFLFETHKGFCEHFASSFVFLMRAAGIPARVVTGYQGGEYNDIGNYYIVRQSDAHAWAEVWLSGRGWVRIDPTATIAPARLELGMAAALPETDSASLPWMSRSHVSWLSNLRFNLDTLTNQWNQWVLGYNPERQFALLTRIGMEEITWQSMAFTLLGGMALLIGFFTFLMLRKLTTVNTDKAQQLYLKFCAKLAKKRIIRRMHEGPQDFAARAAKIKPQLAAPIAEITELYVALRYTNRIDAGALQRLSRAVAAFKL